jgi:zinc transport system permease protein
LFVILLALVVNLCIQTVGILLINALLVVPAAAAANVSSHLRRMFWTTLLGTMACGVLGYHFSTKIVIDDRVGGSLRPGPGGVIVLACVAWFLLSLLIKNLRLLLAPMTTVTDNSPIIIEPTREPAGFEKRII